MDAIQKIKAKLSKYPDVQYSESADGIEVHPRDQSGFTVGLSITPSGFTVNFDGWHEEFGRRFSWRHRDQVGGRRIRERRMDTGLRDRLAPAALLAVGAGRIPSEPHSKPGDPEA